MVFRDFQYYEITLIYDFIHLLSKVIKEVHKR